MRLSDLTCEEASSLLERYPAFTYAALRIMQTTDDPSVRDRMRKRVAAATGSMADLREILGADSEPLAGFYPDMATPHPTTDATITRFIERFGSPDAPLAYTPGEADDSGSEEAASLSVTEDEETEMPVPTETPIVPDDATSSAIDAFLKTVPPPPVPLSLRDRTPAAPSTPELSHYEEKKSVHEDAPSPTEEKRPDGAALTESFARIMIKNGNYRKALEIMTELNLKNSEKNIYFADQIRFLKKLILISKQ